MCHPDGASRPLTTLESLAKRGKLPGYEARSDTSFRVDAFGNPFDADLLGTIRSREPLTISFELRVRRTMPLVFSIITILTIWPGVLITDSLIPGEWGWWPTHYWYLPLTIIPTPWLAISLARKTRTTTRAHAQEQIKAICASLDATPTGPAFDSDDATQEEPAPT
ncbi:MAG: hypothetical protein ACF8GE_10675 [Phycisphaerales bacterium JB043]